MFFFYPLIALIFFISAETTNSNGNTQQTQYPQPSPHPQSTCPQIPMGGSRTINEEWFDSPTGVERKYRITREQGNQFRVDLNLDFSSSVTRALEVYGNQPVAPSEMEGMQTPMEARRHMIQDAIFSRTNSCFNSMRGKVRSPDGTIINFNLVRGPKAHGVPKVEIGINTADHRSNSADWAGSIDCPTIIHESLHLLGLCDGYHEQTAVTEQDRMPYAGEDNIDKRYSPNLFDCRSIEPESSIMRNQWEALGDFYDIYICPPTGTISHNVTQFPQYCPDGSIGFYQTVDRVNFERWVREFGQEYTFFYKPTPQRTDTLSSAQTRLITNPGCEGTSGRYITCSQNAYRTHSMEGCIDTPEFCRNGDHLR